MSSENREVPERRAIRSPKILGEGLEDRRFELGLTQQQVADRAGIDERYLRDLEKGLDTLAVRRIFTVLRALDLHLEIVEGR